MDVVLLTNVGAYFLCPFVPGMVGKIVVSDPNNNYYEVDFGEDRLLVLRNNQFRPATSEEIEEGFAVL